MIRKFVLILIKTYQKTLSFDHGFLGKVFPNTRFCKFNPTCSEYGYTAIEKYGIFKGGGLFLKRFVKCNPFTKPGTYDPVP
ncbi:MAG: membrane protein insertion efficiency factor YidD [Candidatus Dojkabacteria bacterium]|jgi:putative membrane protein insertion efficiency factor